MQPVKTPRCEWLLKRMGRNPLRAQELALQLGCMEPYYTNSVQNYFCAQPFLLWLLTALCAFIQFAFLFLGVYLMLMEGFLHGHYEYGFMYLFGLNPTHLWRFLTLRSTFLLGQ